MSATTNQNVSNGAVSIESIVLKLFDIGAVKFGDFTLKSGIQSPIYIDLRIIVSYPSLLQEVSELMWNKISSLKFDVVCGVPYTALPIATSISLKHRKPMVMRRKEVKKYGTKKAIEGEFKPNSKCLIIEDLVTSGTSVLETVNVLNQVKLNVNDVVVLIDRQQGGKENLFENNLNLYSCYTISEMLSILLKYKKIDQNIINKVNIFLKENSHVKPKLDENDNDKNKNKRLSYSKRSELCNNKIAKQLLLIMENKKTNLCVAADISTCEQVLKLADEIGPFICMLKTHIDILIDFTPKFIQELQIIATKHNFLIFEDRKFADIGNTVMKQFGEGIYKISSWAHIVNAHCIPGPGIIEGLKQVSLKSNNNTDNDKSNNNDGNSEEKSTDMNSNDNNKQNVNHGLLLLAEMSSKGNLATDKYTETSIQWAKDYSDFVIGFISRRKLIDQPNFIHMTPGVNLKDKGDKIGQQYLTPEKVICENGSDMIIVGRGVYRAENKAEAAKLYRDAAWSAYQAAL